MTSKPEWACSQCTFLNPEETTSCKMCEFKRPQTKAKNNYHTTQSADDWYQKHGVSDPFAVVESSSSSNPRIQTVAAPILPQTQPQPTYTSTQTNPFLPANYVNNNTTQTTYNPQTQQYQNTPTWPQGVLQYQTQAQGQTQIQYSMQAPTQGQTLQPQQANATQFSHAQQLQATSPFQAPSNGVSPQMRHQGNQMPQFQNHYTQASLQASLQSQASLQASLQSQGQTLSPHYPVQSQASQQSQGQTLSPHYPGQSRVQVPSPGYPVQSQGQTLSPGYPGQSQVPSPGYPGQSQAQVPSPRYPVQSQAQVPSPRYPVQSQAPQNSTTTAQYMPYYQTGYAQQQQELTRAPVPPYANSNTQQKQFHPQLHSSQSQPQLNPFHIQAQPHLQSQLQSQPSQIQSQSHTQQPQPQSQPQSHTQQPQPQHQPHTQQYHQSGQSSQPMRKSQGSRGTQPQPRSTLSSSDSVVHNPHSHTGDDAALGDKSPRDDSFLDNSEMPFECQYDNCGAVFDAWELFESHMETHRAQEAQRGSTPKRKDYNEGYEGQYERSLVYAFAKGKISEKKMGKILATMKKSLNKADTETKTKGIVSLIKSEFRLKQGFELITSKDVDHFFTSYGDAGWGCGYRNLQMLSSYLLQFPTMKKVLFGGSGYIPSVPIIQEWVEKCWAAGFDPEGAKIFSSKITKTKALLGTTDIAALMRFFGIKMDVIDFFSQRLPDAVIEAQQRQRPPPERIFYYEPNQELLNWAWNYFQEKKKKKDKFIPPLYLQHPGHSRTIIGASKNKKSGEIVLFLLDPSHFGPAVKSDLRWGNGISHVRRPLGAFRHESYQIGFIRDSELMTKPEMEKSKAMDYLGDRSAEIKKPSK